MIVSLKRMDDIVMILLIGFHHWLFPLHLHPYPLHHLNSINRQQHSDEVGKDHCHPRLSIRSEKRKRARSSSWFSLFFFLSLFFVLLPLTFLFLLKKFTLLQQPRASEKVTETLMKGSSNETNNERLIEKEAINAGKTKRRKKKKGRKKKREAERKKINKHCGKAKKQKR